MKKMRKGNKHRADYVLHDYSLSSSAAASSSSSRPPPPSKSPTFWPQPGMASTPSSSSASRPFLSASINYAASKAKNIVNAKPKKTSFSFFSLSN